MILGMVVCDLTYCEPKWLAKFFNGLGKCAYLLALDVRVSFYTEIGFRIAGREIVLERIDIEKDSAAKGRLEER